MVISVLAVSLDTSSYVGQLAGRVSNVGLCGHYEVRRTTMSEIGFMALAANALVAVLLFAYRSDDANMRSVWLWT